MLLRDPYLYLDMEGEKEEEEEERQKKTLSYCTISKTLLAMMRKLDVHSAKTLTCASTLPVRLMLAVTVAPELRSV